MHNQKERKKQETENRLDNLINVVEKRERTERHLEQYDHEEGPETLEASRRIQDIRDEEIENIKNNIVNNGPQAGDESENLKRRYEFTEEYIENNKGHMSSEDLNNAKQKQYNRKQQMDQLGTD